MIQAAAVWVIVEMPHPGTHTLLAEGIWTMHMVQLLPNVYRSDPLAVQEMDDNSLVHLALFPTFEHDA